MLGWSIVTVTMGGTLEAKLAAAARAGFRAVEIFENDLTFFSGRPKDVRRLVSDLGLEIVAFQPMRDFEAMPEPARAANFERARRKFDLMHELSANLLNLCSNVSEDAIDDAERAAADLAELAELAATRGMRIGYEALAWGRYVKDWTQAWDLIRQVDSPNLGIVLDSFHICARRNPLAPIRDIPANRIALVQVADAPGLLMDPLSLSRHHRCFPGQGDFPIEEYLDAALATGYRGAISLEIFNDQFRGAPANDVARDGMRSLIWLGERMAQHGGAAAPPATTLPPAQPIECIEFVEFAAAGANADRLSRLIEGIGFTRVAKHRSKQVELYRQNDVNLVLNREQDGFSHAFYLMHGVCVCAIAFRFPNPRLALERANALGSPTYWGRVGPGEAMIPAVAGVENSLLYFVDGAEGQRRIWDRDFVFDKLGQIPGPLQGIDHLSNVARRSEFLSWLLFYKAVLGFIDEPQVEVADPYGAFYSRVIRSPDGRVRIPVNVADGGPTGVSRFIDAFGGGGVQQIAFATDDLFAFVENARAKDVPFLAIPDNYYDDLAARYQLPEDQLERLRRLGILYDRSRSGEFFHIYTEMFDDRFFFEILQRRNYDQFGAANTPVRLAAQAAAQERAQQTRALFED